LWRVFRLLEVNGKVVLSVKSKNDLNRLLEVSPSSVRAVVMHDGPTADQLEVAALRRELEACRARVEDTDRSRHAYKTENVRLSHRVSYLEDQVSELIKCRSAAASAPPPSNGVQLFQRGSNSAMVRSKSPKHGVSAIQQYKRKQVVYDDCARPAAAQEGPVKTRIRTVPRLYGSSASVESLASSADAVVAAKSYDDLHGVASPKRNRYPGGGGGGGRNARPEERWIDGPRVSKSRARAALLQQMAAAKQQEDGGGTAAGETWIDGPMHAGGQHANVYGFMDYHKKDMIKKWVEHQVYQVTDKLQQNRRRDGKEYAAHKTGGELGPRGRASGQEENGDEEPERGEPMPVAATRSAVENGHQVGRGNRDAFRPQSRRV